MWPNRKLLELIGIDTPIIQAPMAGANGSEMAIAVSEAGALGSLPCAILNPDKARTEIAVIRQQTSKPLNVNFFCHDLVERDLVETDPVSEAAWRQRLAGYYQELGVDAPASKPTAGRSPFDEAMCEVVEETRPEVVSFHFGLPAQALLSRVRACGSLILSTATTVEEAEWLEANGCDAIIAQGYEAGGHRGMFLGEDITTQPGTLALVPQVVDAVKVPVIAAGGIADGRGIAAAFALGAAGVQIGTAYLLTPQSLISDLHRARLQSAKDNHTALTNVFSGKPARGIVNRVMREVGPMSDQAPAFPTAGGALTPLKAKAEAAGDTGFSSLWSGQSASLIRRLNSGELTLQLAANAQQRLRELGSAT
jgi:nitronate monooxygenase